MPETPSMSDMMRTRMGWDSIVARRKNARVPSALPLKARSDFDSHGPAGELRFGVGDVGEEGVTVEGDGAGLFVEADEAQAGGFVVELFQDLFAGFDGAVGYG